MVSKIPQSVLVVVHTAQLQVLLLQRAGQAEFWQSVTGSKDFADEPWEAVAAREVREETGIDVFGAGCRLYDWQLENVYTIYPEWQHRYALGVWHNTERVFSLEVPALACVDLNPGEHTAFAWHAWREAADRCTAASNAEAILLLPRLVCQSLHTPRCS